MPKATDATFVWAPSDVFLYCLEGVSSQGGDPQRTSGGESGTLFYFCCFRLRGWYLSEQWRLTLNTADPTYQVFSYGIPCVLEAQEHGA